MKNLNLRKISNIVFKIINEWVLNFMKRKNYTLRY